MLMSGNQSDRQHLHIGVVGQGNAAYGFRIVQGEGVAVQQEGTAIFSARAGIAIGHGHSGGFAGKVLRREPVAEALGKGRTGAVGEMHHKVLRCLIAVDASGQHSQGRELAGRQRDGLSRGTYIVRSIGRTQSEGSAIEGHA